MNIKAILAAIFSLALSAQLLSAGEPINPPFADVTLTSIEKNHIVADGKKYMVTKHTIINNSAGADKSLSDLSPGQVLHIYFVAKGKDTSVAKKITIMVATGGTGRSR